MSGVARLRHALGSTSANWETNQRLYQRSTHGIGISKAQPIPSTIVRHKISSPVPLKITSRRVPLMFRQIHLVHAAMTQAQPMMVMTEMYISNCQPMKVTALPLKAIGSGCPFELILLRWLAGNLSSNGQPLPIAFNGSAVTFIGWQLLTYVSLITIIGWAWVTAAWVRWICRNISGTRREVIFNGSGLEILWRTIVVGIGCGFLIPIPWVLRWYNRWFISQFELVERAA